MKTKIKSLITGATGFVGSHIAEKLKEEGEEVICLARKSGNIDFLKKLKAEIRYGSVEDYDSVCEAMKNINRVYHAAAATDEWISKEDAYKSNVVGTRNLLNSALENKVDRFFFISSLGVMGLRNHYGTEKPDYESDDVKTGDNYIDTKIESEKLVKAFHEHAGLPTTILRPGFVYGPRDMKLIKRIIEKLHAGKFAFLGNGKNKMNLVYAGNFADAVILAGKTNKAIGQEYNVTDDLDIDMETFVFKIADLWNMKRPTKYIPLPVAKTLTSVIEGTARLIKKKTPPILTKTRLKFMSLNLEFDISKAKEEFGYSPKVGIDEGLKLTKKWIEKEKPYDKRWLE